MKKLILVFTLIKMIGLSFISYAKPSEDFRVNDNSGSSDQIMPRIAADGTINFIVVWQDGRNGNWDIYGQLYTCNGLKQGENFKINEGAGIGNQCSPSVALDCNGNFTVVWRDDNDHSIYGQRFSPNGTKIGNNFKISDTPVPSYENHPAIATDLNGNFIVVWHDFDNLLFCQRYDDQAVKRGINFLIDGSGANQYYPDIVIAANGNFIVVWGDNRRNQANDVFGRQFNDEGTAIGSSFLVSDPLPSYQSDPRIAMDGTGDFVVVWEDTRNEPSWNFGDVYGQRISSDGKLIGINFKVNDNNDYSYQAGAAITTNMDDNRFLVAWDDYRHGWDDIDIYGRYFSADGEATLPGSRINQDIGMNIQHSVDVKWVKNRVYFVWTDNRVAGQGKDIIAQIQVFNSSPEANAGEDQTVESTMPNSGEVTLYGGGSTDPDGDQLTYTWHENNNIIAGPTVNPISQVKLTLGGHIIELTVDDAKGGTDTDDVIINVVDTTPPTLKISLLPNVLWPPNHKMVDIQADVFVIDICDPAPSVYLASVVSNEPDNGLGDGDKPNDIQGADFGTFDTEFQLRAERSGTGSGRIYTVTYSASDASGNSFNVSDSVFVPHNLGKSLSLNESIYIPEKFELFQNYPNPFNPETEISYQIPKSCLVSLIVYNQMGQTIRTLKNENQEPGKYVIRWDGKDNFGGQVSSGIYMYVLKAGEFQETKKAILLQ